MQSSFERRFEAMENQIFSLNEENTALKNTIEELKKREVTNKTTIDNNTKAILCNNRDILELKQKQFEKRAIVLSKENGPNLNLPSEARARVILKIMSTFIWLIL